MWNQQPRSLVSSGADHLSRLHTTSLGEICDTFPDEQLLTIVNMVPWFAHIINYLVTKSVPEYWNTHQKKKKFLWYSIFLLGTTPIVPCRGWSDYSVMRSGGGARSHSIDVSLIFMCRTFCVEKDLSEGATKWLLLANSIQGCDQVLQGMSKAPICMKHLKARWNTLANQPWGRDFLSLGDWFYGTISTVGGKRVHSCSGGLCVQMGRGNTDEDKRSSSG